MNVTKEIEIIDIALYTHNTLILSDIHIGFEDSLSKQGVFVPRDHMDQLLKKVTGLLSTLKKQKKEVNTIVINGDLKDALGHISNQEWRNTLKFMDFLRSKVAKVILVKGNHDTILEPIVKKRQIELHGHYWVSKDIVCIHGDKEPSKEIVKQAKTIIMGHQHPCVTIQDETRKEKYKCFAKGTYKKKTLIVMPSFNPLTEGICLITEKIISPLIDNIENFEVFVVGEEVLPFGKIRDLDHM